MKKTILILAPVAGIMLMLSSCYKDNAEDMYPPDSCDLSTVTYTNSVIPVMQQSCALAGCHIDARTTGISLSTYEGVAAVASNGKLLQAIKHTGPSPMPQGGAKLDDCTISKIEKWVTDGAPNN